MAARARKSVPASVEEVVQEEIVSVEEVVQEEIVSVEEVVTPNTTVQEEIAVAKMSNLAPEEPTPVRVLELETQITHLEEQLKAARQEYRSLTKPATTVSKMDLAKQYVADHPNLARKDYVAAFQSELGLTVSGSKTYVQLILSKLKQQQ